MSEHIPSVLEEYAPPIVPNRPPGSPDWPTDPAAPADYTDLVEPIIEAFHAAATWRNRTSEFPVDVPWRGLPLPHIGSGAPEARLSALWRRMDRENGRTFLRTILNLALDLGIEQGRRLHRSESRHATRVAGAKFHIAQAIKYLEDAP